MIWRCRDRIFDTGRRAVVAGIVNVTPDSFSDGGEHASRDAAVAFARALARDGADILDVGGESTRPGAAEISADEECARAIPVVEILAGEGFAVSIDTRREATARAALAAGAVAVNCPAPVAEGDPVAAAAAACGAGFVATWSDGIPARKPEGAGDPGTVVERAAGFLREAVRRVIACGAARECIAVDPGFGFGKSADEDMELLRGLSGLCQIAPLMAGTSRKSFLGAACGEPDPKKRLGAGIASAIAARRAGAGVLRVHDVAETRQALDFSDKLVYGGRQ